MILIDKLNLTAEQKNNTILELKKQTIQDLHDLGLLKNGKDNSKKSHNKQEEVKKETDQSGIR